LASVSYAPFEGNVHPDAGGIADVQHIRADLKLLAPQTRAIRTYSSTGGEHQRRHRRQRNCVPR
jgi:hypothetical protein